MDLDPSWDARTAHAFQQAVQELNLAASALELVPE